jgi:prolyl-tRNA editing enzyme YbaK/EbsC (Cys-tRNA(Pro) deacylase)
MVKVGKKTTRYVLAVVPGDRRVDLEAIKRLLGGTYASFASPEIAERLAGSVTGTILPFAFDTALELIVDPELLEQQELFFNAARLDRSIVLDPGQYVALARPRIAPIALADAAQPVSSSGETPGQAQSGTDALRPKTYSGIEVMGGRSQSPISLTCRKKRSLL